VTVGNLSLWADTAGPYQPNDSLREEIAVDVAVIGGGLTGLSAAWHLRRDEPSLRVAVLEQDIVGEGPSGRNAGWVMTQIGLHVSLLKQFYGKQRAREAYDYAHRALDYARELVRDHEMQSDAVPDAGVIRIALGSQWIKDLESAKGFYDDLGIGDHVEWLDEAQLRGELTSPLARGAALVEPNLMFINPCKHVREWKRLVGEAGGEVYERSPVIGVTRTDRGFDLATPQGRVRADRIVIATNGYQHLLPGDLVSRREQLPFYAYAMATEPLSEADWDAVGWTRRYGIEDALQIFHWFRPTADGRIAFGGRSWAIGGGTGLSKDYEPKAFALGERDLRVFFPQLKDVKITHRWGGAVSTTMDLVPRIGFVGEDRRIIRVNGCWGHGVALAHLNGQTIADLLTGKDSDLTEFWLVNRDGRDWPPGPLAPLSINAIGGLFGLLDRWNVRRAPSTAVNDEQRQALSSLWAGSARV
jgi:glycine/D-amino acid oxidase-like deaminating enzyme